MEVDHMNLMKITLACQSLKNLREVKTELEKYAHQESWIDVTDII